MSIRRYLVLIICSILVLFTFSAAVHGYHASMKQATLLADQNLKLIVHTLEEDYISHFNVPSENTKYNVIVFQIWENKHLLSTNISQVTTPLSSFEEGYSENNFLNKRWRVLSHENKNAGKDRWILVAQPLQTMNSLMGKFILSALMPMVISIPLIALIIWVVIWRALTPLSQLAKNLEQKKANDLTPIEFTHLPHELKKVNETLNHLFFRLTEAFSREKRFASNAAHELRTPLSVLKLNANNLFDEYPDNETTLHLSQSVDRMAHVIDQILILNRTTPEQFLQNIEQFDLQQIIQQVIAQLYPEIKSRHQNIELDAITLFINSNEFSMVTLIQNLISNASKYTPDGGNILVSLKQQQQSILLTVEDSGDGIPADERQKVFNRFYRIGGDKNSSKVTGCGLGLSIVKYIVDLHGGLINLNHSSLLGGLKVKIILPMQMDLNNMVIHEN